MKIAVTSKAFAANDELVGYLKEFFPHYKFNTTGKQMTRDQLIEFASDCQGMILALEPIDDYVLSKLPQLEAVAKYGVGLDNVDKAACQKHNVELLWTAGVNKGSVAEMALGFMLMLKRNLWTSANLLNEGQWLKKGGASLYGATVGIIGLGHIGKELVRLLAPFKCNILVNDIDYDLDFIEKYQLTMLDKSSLLAQSDIISLHTPLTSETHHIIDEQSLRLCQPHTVILNTARGGLIDDNALKCSLLNNQIAGAAIDVYDEKEPPTDLSLLSIYNLITTPHIGGNSAQAVYAMGESAVDHLRNYFENCSNDTLSTR